MHNIDVTKLKELIDLVERADALRKEADEADARVAELRAILWPEPAPVAAPVPAPVLVPAKKGKPRGRRGPDKAPRKTRTILGDTISNQIREALRTFGPMSIDDIAALVNRTPHGAVGAMSYMLNRSKEIIRLEGNFYALAK